MMRTHEGERIYHFFARTRPADNPVRTDWKTPEDMKPEYVRNRLCELGPERCGDCRLCAFGRWYVDHGMGDKKAGKRKPAVAV